MSDCVSIFSKQDGSTTNIIVLANEKSSDGTFESWSGSIHSRLSFTFETCDTNREIETERVLDRGYIERKDLTFDLDTEMVTSLEKESEPSVIPTQLWYRISSLIPVNQVREVLHTIVTDLAKTSSVYAEILEKLPVFLALNNGEFNGGVEFKEGPLAVLLLFALRRSFILESGISPVQGDLVQVSDDFNNILPDDFYDLGPYIVDSGEEMFVWYGWTKRNSVHESGVNCFSEEAVKFNLSELCSLGSIKQLAIAMSCIEAPFVFSEINTETTAAFF